MVVVTEPQLFRKKFHGGPPGADARGGRGGRGRAEKTWVGERGRAVNKVEDAVASRGPGKKGAGRGAGRGRAERRGPFGRAARPGERRRGRAATSRKEGVEGGGGCGRAVM